jgi:hypothetical protein
MAFENFGFFLGQLSPFASLEGGIEWDIGKADALEIGDLIADGLKHSLDLMKFTLRYADLTRTGGGERNLCGLCGGFFSDIHAFTEKLHVFIRQGSLTFKAIRFFNVALR